jgi:ribosome-associated protein
MCALAPRVPVRVVDEPVPDGPVSGASSPAHHRRRGRVHRGAPQGAGGQNVNKVSNAAHLRFDIARRRCPRGQARRCWPARPAHQQRRRGGHQGAGPPQPASNQADALARLQALVDEVLNPDAPRLATKPTRASKRRRLEGKARRSDIKSGRQRVTD